MRLRTGVICLSLMVGLSLAAMAQPDGGGSPQGGRRWGGAGGAGRGAGQSRLYDPATVESIAGEIASLDAAAGPNGGVGIHATLKPEKGEPIAVHLGPAWYLDRQPVTLRQGDHITVRGSRIVLDGKPAIIAAEVTKGGQVLRLRDESGVPLWAGQRRRGC